MQFEGVSIEVCPYCGGMWFDKGELSEAIGGWIAPRTLVFGTTGALRRPRRCPKCYVRLGRRELAGGSAIEIDQCPKCSGIWLDRGEFTASRRFLASRGKLSARPPARGEVEGGGPAVALEDSASIAFFQYLTGLPVEVGVPQLLFPPVVTAVIALNTAILAFMLLSGSFELWVKKLGAIPADISSMRNLYTLITSVFVHAGVFHLLGNMYFLWITGDNIEERFGRVKFFGFYLLCGVVASLAHVMSNPSSNIPAVGASGAISGLMGAYMVLYPTRRFLIRWLFMFYPIKFEIPAFGYFLFWIVLQVIYASAGVGGVAWFAHIGGFASGVVIGLIVRLGASAGRELQY